MDIWGKKFRFISRFTVILTEEYDWGVYRWNGKCALLSFLSINSSDHCIYANAWYQGKSIFLSEHGVGSENNAVRLVKLYEQQGATEDLEDLLVYQSERDKFLEDWKKFGLDKLYADPDNFFQDSHRIQAQHRRTGLSVIRSNPKIIGYNITGLIDQGRSSEGIMCTTFRELKPGMADILKNGWSSLRWCIFVEPINLYSGNSITLEVVLVNEDILLPGDYEYNVRISGPHGKLYWRKIIRYKLLLIIF